MPKNFRLDYSKRQRLTNKMSNTIVRQEFTISRFDRRNHKKHNSFLIWFTGLSGSGKSTIANAVEERLHQKNIHTYTLDGDNIREGLNKDLSFSSKEREENIRRIGEVAHLFIDAGIVVLASFISPYRKGREDVKAIVGKDNFIEVYVNTPLEECERRDVKGLYAKARTGEIQSFTGISAPYEAPENPDIEIDTKRQSVERSADQIIEHITNKLAL